ncbi:type II secretion system protein [Patescibacteria group bacterium]|nr:type II secretion system protein [Patescibacteria group bacterium]
MKKGFTLIELLVVVAIIGILASVVLASLSTARNSAKDAAIKAALKGGQTEMELYFIENDYYNTDGGTGTTCGATLTSFQNSISNNGGTGVCASVSGGATYSYYADLSDGSTYFCVDSSGFAGEQAGAAADGDSCSTT